ncbi:Epimerase domain-containing protein [Mycena indigotica]|uniref:Epimerase domain-containing protein n=1 Tax=Mycena indigotica TaxID=2126181 RepID=A0A8H6WCX0_9AGAR|nr:Epimerase domain-containing protein [Mycena indigotica]KAF7310188.1 Epimerase domain-containing protein [Mycena indigotica]
MSSPELIFVTGASGFLGAHVIHQLLEKGYHVRGTARGTKADDLQASYARYGDRFQVVKIADIGHDQFPEVLKGVSAVLHLATPMPGKIGFEEQLKGAVDGTMNVVIQAEKAGIRKVVVTSSIAAVQMLPAVPGTSFTDKDWTPMTKEHAIASKNPVAVYVVSKKLSEQALWKWADKHPHVDVTTLNPTFFFGPLAPNFPVPPVPTMSTFSTNYMVYNLLFPKGVFPPMATTYIDVRDVAAAHVAALSSPPTSKVGRKRVILSSPHGASVPQLLQLLAEKRPALKGRLTGVLTKTELDVLPLDWARVDAVLGLKKSDFRTLEETFLQTVDELVQIEEGWKRAGHAIRKPKL